MRRRSGYAVIGLIVVFLAGGCATTRGKGLSQENESLKMQVQNLEKTVEQKDAEIDSLRRSLSQTTEEKYTAAKMARAEAATEVPTIRQIQTALRNAGFDPGSIDGKMGRMTRSAVRDFQKANGLSVDGKVGKKTWAVLSLYLERQAVQQ
ncbi:MAG: peptidoglycan-binding domain-containing protein [Candidatus Omnitrophica bacterium]|nr:peptidoglycan-binding domain-containing protein [Candidatus Omnitrophota bacterium]